LFPLLFISSVVRYRAPEIVLAQPYSASVDIWCIGCIFAELISMMKGNQDDNKKRRPLFPGESCGDLSNDDDVDDNNAINEKIQPYQEVLDSLDETTLHNRLTTMSKEHTKSNDSLLDGNMKKSNTIDNDDSDVDEVKGNEMKGLGGVGGKGTGGALRHLQSFDSLFRAISEEYNEYDVAQINKSVFSDAFHDLKKFESQRSQLNLIFELIGTPTYEEMYHLDLKTKTMLLTMGKKKPKVNRLLVFVFPFFLLVIPSFLLILFLGF
jgi:serine/threonine protein kinase